MDMGYSTKKAKKRSKNQTEKCKNKRQVWYQSRRGRRQGSVIRKRSPDNTPEDGNEDTYPDTTPGVYPCASVLPVSCPPGWEFVSLLRSFACAFSSLERACVFRIEVGRASKLCGLLL
jgi:hypothetical protein